MGDRRVAYCDAMPDEFPSAEFPSPGIPLAVASEVGRLREVIAHRPGLELERLTPTNKDAFLFDEVLWVSQARSEHAAFVAALREAGVIVHLFDRLLQETVAVPEARDFILDAVFDERVYGPMAVEAVREVFAGMDDATLTRHLIGGLSKRELLRLAPEPPSIPIRTMALDDFVVTPLPNHLFSRDASAWIYDGLAINSMRKHARIRETINYEAIYHWHPRFAAHRFARWSHGSLDGIATTEGGDIFVLGNGAVMVGMSERTTPSGLERLASRLFAAGTVTRIVAIELPHRRSFMHLDTVISMVDEETFTKFAGMGMLPAYTIRPGAGDDHLSITAHPPEDMHKVMASALGLDDIRILTATQDVYAAAREQWDDGLNVLAIAPGVVVAYERNVTINAHLQENGIDVITVPGTELGRGRGGPRCMTCPISRAPV